MQNLYKAIWLQALYMKDGGRDTDRRSRARWLRDCLRSGYIHPSVFAR
jgi:hypothetical protein